jgi:hypothetical protein
MPTGSCLCGDVAYEITAPFLESHHCHCGFCRKSHGTPYATYGVAPAASLEWLRGEEKIARYESSPGFRRAFCARCGSIVPGDPAAGFTFVPFGNLDGDPGSRPEMHMFTQSRAPWWEIRDGLPQHAAFPPTFGGAPVQPTRRPPGQPGGRPRGSCLCGRSAFVLEADPVLARNCFCGRCRKARAAGHASNLLVPIAGLRITQGAEQIGFYKIPEARFFAQVFCRGCGSKLPRTDAERGIAVVPMGALDDDPGLAPQSHIFVADKAAWIGIHDPLPQYPAGPPPA